MASTPKPTLDEILAERARLLLEAAPYLFKIDAAPAECLLRRIMLYQRLAAQPSLIANPKAIKVSTAELIEMHTPNLEIVVADDGEAPRCPISQSDIVEKWRGKCGHLFERSAVLSFIKNGHQTCPVLGCTKKLVEDV